MSTLNVVHTQKGMTLVELMIAVALVSGIALVTAKLMDDQAAQQSHIKSMAAITNAVNKIEFHLSNPSHCRQMLQGKSVGSTVAGDLSITSNSAVVNIIGPGTYPEFIVPAGGVRLENSIYGSTVADLVVDFRITKKFAFASKRGNISRRIPVVVQTNAGVITECGPILADANETAERQMCESLRGTTDPDPFKGAVRWDTSLTPPKCVLNSVKCPYGQVATRLTSLGGIICQNIQTQVNLEEMFDTTGVNCSGVSPLNLRIIPINGKFKVTCF
jgi:prepilin-type N-terminal cleavage/methylation domain-containing protein